MQKELVLKEREIELKDLMIHEKKVQLGLIPYSSSAYNDENSPDHLLTIGWLKKKFRFIDFDLLVKLSWWEKFIVEIANEILLEVIERNKKFELFF